MLELKGPLFFPVTPFTKMGAIDAGGLSDHIAQRIDDGAACVFAACGTGEFHALSGAEHRQVTAVAVAAAAGRVPVIVGAGGSVAAASEQLHSAEREGADGILLLPPYLVASPQAGLVQYVRTIAAASGLPIIVYQRGVMTLTPDSAVQIAQIPNVIGLKDGVGDIGLMQCIVIAIRNSGPSDFMFFNGVATAEVTMKPYRAIGVPLYSSAVFTFAPDLSMAFHDALEANDEPLIDILLHEFFIPFTGIRDRELGYQISLVKSAVPELMRSGGVRAPLVETSAAAQTDLQNLLARARASLNTFLGSKLPESSGS